jgi:GNAT superfamily N-acetyltransferase
MPLSFELRPTGKSDFDFCWQIYRATVQPLMAAPADWHEADQRHVVEAALADSGSSVLRVKGTDSGWLHMTESRQVIELRQFQIVPALRNQGVGTEFLTWMKERADRKRKDLTVTVAADSAARRLLDRLGFKAVPASGPTVTMRY